MPILVDTNILLRCLHPGHPHYLIANSALVTLRQRNEQLYVAPQNLIEFWAVATRSPHDNGLGLTHLQAELEILKMRRLFRLLPSTVEVLNVWQRIVVEQEVVGKQTHDAHLVAMMEVHSIGSILTFNISHFIRFSRIAVINPAAPI